jgi:hypothetical protein
MNIFAFLAYKRYNVVFMHWVQKGQIQERKLYIYLLNLVKKTCTVVN